MSIETHPDFKPPTTDKRKKVFKEYEANFIEAHKDDSKGLGDTIEKVLVKTGVKKLADKVFDKLGVDCGCEETKADLNKIAAYKTVNCIDYEMYCFIDNFLSKPITSGILHEDQNGLNAILEHVTQQKHPRLGCCYGDSGRIDEIKKIYNAYQPKEKE